MPESNFCISLNNVTKTVNTTDGTLDVVKNISLNVPYRRALVIQGASGSGKTTLLGLMAGLDQSSSGDIILLGEDLTSKNEEQRARVRAGRVGFVFQSFQLVQGATALQNVMLPIELGGKADAFELACKHLQEVGLESKADTLVEQLSGGEQQRVSIARAFAVEPTILFADEPTGNLDAKTGKQITDLMFRLRDQTGTTLVLVTHEQSLAERGDVHIQIESGELLNAD
ncbi:MAG: ATP-binding cassette domain-containing protein [Proteobacteria bacterium]|nr:ATP-binding cassette domain-containing protein [Pseudomonadota bacterium]MCP4188510.1 ATP-binding cassette domain-containing protein [Gammaproteobacteria bacterium]